MSMVAGRRIPVREIVEYIDLSLVAAVAGSNQGCQLAAGQPGELIQEGLGRLVLVVVLERSGSQHPGLRPEVEIDRPERELP